MVKQFGNFIGYRDSFCPIHLNYGGKEMPARMGSYVEGAAEEGIRGEKNLEGLSKRNELPKDGDSSGLIFDTMENDLEENPIQVGEGSRGGLSLGWKIRCSMTFRSVSKDHIDVEVQETQKGPIWRWTGFYGSLYKQEREMTWNLLRRLGRPQNLSWLVSGDFNEILFSHEKNGGLPRDERRMEEFRKG
ncbi:hypothetical protein PVK06_016943 [Gossypium arboreum]|uniref:Reverse transcriptase n=1 Tax=Gossypium arboreum TaxID=29729 RepID=A0ABR0Q1U4_GOSAR|nr:hypothetical protein PVK06_016943 [Gossypium arboreum]